MLLLRVYLLGRRRARTVTAVQSICMKYPTRGKRWVRRGVEHQEMVRGVSWVQSRHSTLAALLPLHYSGSPAAVALFQPQGRDFRRNLGEMSKASLQL